VFPNAAEKIDGPRYRPERRFGMAAAISGHRLGQRRQRSLKASEMRKTSSGQALAKSSARRSHRHLGTVLTVPPN
jgi:hypothetical protein